jgi:hypothetical protein
MLTIHPLLPELEAHNHTDTTGDENEVEWCLTDPKSKREIVAIYPLNEEGGAYARRLATSYNKFGLAVELLDDMLRMVEEDHAEEIANDHHGDETCSYCDWMKKATPKTKTPQPHDLLNIRVVDARGTYTARVVGLSITASYTGGAELAAQRAALKAFAQLAPGAGLREPQTNELLITFVSGEAGVSNYVAGWEYARLQHGQDIQASVQKRHMAKNHTCAACGDSSSVDWVQMLSLCAPLCRAHHILALGNAFEQQRIENAIASCELIDQKSEVQS